MRAASGVAALLLGACAVQGPERPPLPPDLGRIAIVASPLPAIASLQGYARSKPGGAARGFGQTFAACGSMGGSGGCSGSMCGAVYVVLLGVCTAASTVGGVVGAVRADSAREVRAHESSIHGAIDQAPVQQALRDAVVRAAAARGVPPVAAADGATGADTRLEVGVIEVGTVGRGINPRLTLRLTARARLLRAADGVERYVADFVVDGEQHTLEEWAANGGERLAAGLQSGYDQLGEQIAGAMLPAAATAR